MKKTRDARELIGESAGKTVEAWGLMAETSRQAVTQGVALTAAALRDGARLYADLLESNTQAALRAAEQTQAAAAEVARTVQGSITEMLDKVQRLYTPAAE